MEPNRGSIKIWPRLSKVCSRTKCSKTSMQKKILWGYYNITKINIHVMRTRNEICNRGTTTWGVKMGVKGRGAVQRGKWRAYRMIKPPRDKCLSSNRDLHPSLTPLFNLRGKALPKAAMYFFSEGAIISSLNFRTFPSPSHCLVGHFEHVYPLLAGTSGRVWQYGYIVLGQKLRTEQFVEFSSPAMVGLIPILQVLKVKTPKYWHPFRAITCFSSILC